MPNLSEYLLRRFGIEVTMFYFDTAMPNEPHMHVRFRQRSCTMTIEPDPRTLAGEIAPTAERRARSWVRKHEADLMARWHDARKGVPIQPID